VRSKYIFRLVPTSFRRGPTADVDDIFWISYARFVWGSTKWGEVCPAGKLVDDERARGWRMTGERQKLEEVEEMYTLSIYTDKSRDT
jgi:hypothetical protein